MVYLVGIESPEFQLFLEKGSADIGGIVQFAGAKVVEDLPKYLRMPVKKVFVEYRVKVSQC
jgi:hypothetical protein